MYIILLEGEPDAVSKCRQKYVVLRTIYRFPENNIGKKGHAYSSVSAFSFCTGRSRLDDARFTLNLCNARRPNKKMDFMSKLEGKHCFEFL